MSTKPVKKVNAVYLLATIFSPSPSLCWVALLAISSSVTEEPVR